jgi:hypothetical protein
MRSNVKRLTISLSQESLQSKNMLARPYATLVRRTCARVPRVARGKVNLPFLERNCARGNIEPVRLSPDAQRIDIVAASQTLLDCSQRFMHFLGRSVLLYAFGHHLLVLLQGVLSWTINFRIALSKRKSSKTVFFERNLHILQGTCNFGRRKSWQIINLSWVAKATPYRVRVKGYRFVHSTQIKKRTRDRDPLTPDFQVPIVVVLAHLNVTILSGVERSGPPGGGPACAMCPGRAGGRAQRGADESTR